MSIDLIVINRKNDKLKNHHLFKNIYHKILTCKENEILYQFASIKTFQGEYSYSSKGMEAYSNHNYILSSNIVGKINNEIYLFPTHDTYKEIISISNKLKIESSFQLSDDKINNKLYNNHFHKRMFFAIYDSSKLYLYFVNKDNLKATCVGVDTNKVNDFFIVGSKNFESQKICLSEFNSGYWDEPYSFQKELYKNNMCIKKFIINSNSKVLINKINMEA